MSKSCCSSVDSNQLRRGSESGGLSLSSAARHIDFYLLRRIYVVLVAHSIALSLHYLLYGGNVSIAALALWQHSYVFRFGSIIENDKYSEQTVLLQCRLEPVTEGSRVWRVIFEQRCATYWFPLIAPYLCRPRCVFHSAYTIILLIITATSLQLCRISSKTLTNGQTWTRVMER